MRKQLKAVVIAMLVMQVAGCSILTESGLTPDRLLGKVDKQGQAADNTKGTQRSEAKVANPPARTLRFDGHEIVLGETEHEVIDTARLVGMLEPLIEKQKFQTAANLIAGYRETGERLLLERWATGADNEVVQLVADVLSRRSPQSEANWKSLLAIARQQKTQAVQYQAHRNSFAEELKTSEPSNETAEALLAAALKVQHPLVRIDAFRLLGLRELVAGRHAWAESQFRQGIEQAMATGGHRVAADLWLMVAESARRGNQGAATSQAWNNALDLHLTTYRADEPVDIGFWQLADKTRPALFEWPEEVGQLLASHLAATGCSTESPEMVLWTTVAQAQYDRGEFQTALVNFKRAETLSREPNVKWLRIAQARCLAGMGQAPAAAAILSGPAACADAEVSAAAMATMGSIKIQAGAYQQGAQLLHKSLSQTQADNWPRKPEALADMAIAQLILGDTEAGLAALHEAQRQFESSGLRNLLIQSLENELRLLEHEKRVDQLATVKARVVQLERL